MMRTVVLFIFFGVGFLAVQAQVSRCGVGTIDNSKFEKWLASRPSMIAGATASVYRIPVVVHILYDGDREGEGFNHTDQRVAEQIQILNEDFRRKEDTPGFNNHPDGADTRIEFVLAKVDPSGNPTSGIVRVNMKTVEVDSTGGGDIILLCSKFSYWDPGQYLNIWSLPTGLPPSLFLGAARFPVTDLPGNLPKETRKEDGDGVFVNAMNFGHGPIDEDPNYSQGRTLTHEVGHFLGLLHTYSACDPGDYCDDTPPVVSGTNGCPEFAPVACDGRRVMIENYMDVSYDRCMNIFTNDQAARMHVVLNNSPRRKSLLTSPALFDPVTGLPDDEDTTITIYPNPVTDKLYVDTGGLNGSVEISVYSLLGTTLLSRTIGLPGEVVEIPMSDVHEKMLVVRVSSAKGSVRKLIATTGDFDR